MKPDIKLDIETTINLTPDQVREIIKHWLLKSYNLKDPNISFNLTQSVGRTYHFDGITARHIKKPVEMTPKQKMIEDVFADVDLDEVSSNIWDDLLAHDILIKCKPDQDGGND